MKISAGASTSPRASRHGGVGSVFRNAIWSTSPRKSNGASVVRNVIIRPPKPTTMISLNTGSIAPCPSRPVHVAVMVRPNTTAATSSRPGPRVAVVSCRQKVGPTPPHHGAIGSVTSAMARPPPAGPRRRIRRSRA